MLKFRAKTTNKIQLISDLQLDLSLQMENLFPIFTFSESIIKNLLNFLGHSCQFFLPIERRKVLRKEMNPIFFQNGSWSVSLMQIDKLFRGRFPINNELILWWRYFKSILIGFIVECLWLNELTLCKSMQYFFDNLHL